MVLHTPLTFNIISFPCKYNNHISPGFQENMGTLTLPVTVYVRDCHILYATVFYIKQSTYLYFTLSEDYFFRETAFCITFFDCGFSVLYLPLIYLMPFLLFCYCFQINHRIHCRPILCHGKIQIGSLFHIIFCGIIHISQNRTSFHRLAFCHRQIF